MHKPNQDNSWWSGLKANTVTLISFALLVAGAVGYILLSRESRIFYALAHVGALGLMGLFGNLTGYLAARKSRSFRTGFLLGFLLPIVAGIAAVLLFWLPEGGHLYCGGSVCLLVAIVVTVVLLVIRKKAPRTASGAMS